MTLTSYVFFFFFSVSLSHKVNGRGMYERPRLITFLKREDKARKLQLKGRGIYRRNGLLLFQKWVFLSCLHFGSLTFSKVSDQLSLRRPLVKDGVGPPSSMIPFPADSTLLKSTKDRERSLKFQSDVPYGNYRSDPFRFGHLVLLFSK